MSTTYITAVAPYDHVYHRKRNHYDHNIVVSDPLGLFALLSLDLVLEILYRIPVKSLLTLKCVSKPFNSFISDPKFAKDHLRLSKIHHRHRSLLICPWAFFSEGNFLLFHSQLTSVFNNNSTTIIPEMKLNFPLNPSNIRGILHDSCDGIICFEIVDDKYKRGNLLLWNPCTTKFNVLPPLVLENRLPFGRSVGTVYTIGYDHQFTHTYKVVAVSCYQSHTIHRQVKVHTLGTNFWRRIPDFPSQLMGIPQGSVGRFVNGSVHWAIEDQNNHFLRIHDEHDHFSWHILSLHLGNESYQEISQPDYGLDQPLHNFSLGVSRDCLCVFAHTETFLDVWRMNVYGNKDSWTKLFTLPFAQFLGRDGVCLTELYISEEDHQVFVDSRDNKPHVYNYKTGTIKSLKIQGLPCTSFDCNVYVESLISP